MDFMAGHRVSYYVFTDRPDHVPHINIQKGRQTIILKVQSHARWEDISTHHTEMINFPQQCFHQEADYLVCVDADMKFSDHTGVEILSSLFRTLHPGYRGLSRTHFPYERWPRSQAHVPEDEGDFHYTGAFLGGQCQRCTGSARPATRHKWPTKPTTSRLRGMVRATGTSICFTTNPPRSSPPSTCGISS